MPFDTAKLINDARELTVAVERGDLVTAADIARIVGITRNAIGLHIHRGKLQAVDVGIDRYFLIDDVNRAYAEHDSPGLRAYRSGKWREWWAAHPRPSRGR